MFQSIIICLLLFNFMTCAIARAIHGGCFEYDSATFPAYNGKNILIAKFCSWGLKLVWKWNGFLPLATILLVCQSEGSIGRTFGKTFRY